MKEVAGSDKARSRRKSGRKKFPYIIELIIISDAVTDPSRTRPAAPYFLLKSLFCLYSVSMNKPSVKSKPAKASRSPVARKTVSRQVSSNPEPINTVKLATVTVADVTMRAPQLRAHRFRVGQTVLYTSSPISRPGASGTYKVVKLLPSDGDDYQYRIKNTGEAFERVAKESQLELDH